MKDGRTIHEIIGMWPTRAVLASRLGVKTDRVHKWAAQQRIPAEFQQAVLDLAREAGFDLTASELVSAAAMRAGRSEEAA